MTSNAPQENQVETIVEARYVCLLCGQAGIEEFTCSEDGCVVDARGTLFAGNYLLKSKMAAGGYGTVFESEHVFLKKKIAIKILHAYMVKDKPQLLRFQREARVLSTLQHVNVVALSDHGWAPRPFIAMEYVEGKTLQSLIESGPVDAAKAVNIFKQICQGLGAAHAIGIIHRDLKPVNVLLCGDTERPLVKIVDFGIAKLDEGTLTATGEVIGSPSFMSPEQCLGGQVDARADIYAVGCLMYQVLTGKLPFDGENHYVVLRKQIMDAPEALDVVCPGLPAELQRIVMRCLAKEPEARFQTTDELVKALENPKLLDRGKRARVKGHGPLVWPGMLLVYLLLVTCSIPAVKPEWSLALMAVSGLVADGYWFYCIFQLKRQLKSAGYTNKVSPLKSVLLAMLAQGLCAASALYCNSVFVHLMQEGAVALLTLCCSVALWVGWWSLRDFSDFVNERRSAEKSIDALLYLLLANALSVWSVIPLLSSQLYGNWILASVIGAAAMLSVAFGLLALLKKEFDSATSSELSFTKSKAILYSIAVTQLFVVFCAGQADFSKINAYLMHAYDRFQKIVVSTSTDSALYVQCRNLGMLSKHMYPDAEEATGWFALSSGRFEEARQASDRACAISVSVGTGTEYGYLMRFTALVLSGGSEADFAMTRTLMRSVAAGEPHEWPSPAALFLAGDTSRETMFKSAEDGQALAEAHFYSGVEYLLKKDKRSARIEFEATVDSGIRGLSEYRVAKYVLDQRGVLDDDSK